MHTIFLNQECSKIIMCRSLYSDTCNFSSPFSLVFTNPFCENNKKKYHFSIDAHFTSYFISAVIMIFINDSHA